MRGREGRSGGKTRLFQTFGASGSEGFFETSSRFFDSSSQAGEILNLGGMSGKVPDKCAENAAIAGKTKQKPNELARQRLKRCFGRDALGHKS